MEGVTQYSDVTHSGFYTDHLFYFFIFITPSVFCIIFLIYVSMSIKYLKTDQVPDFLQRSHSSFLCQKMKLSSAILRNTFHYYCRTPLSISAEFSIFCKTSFNIFAGHLSTFLQNSSRYSCRTTSNIFCKIPFNIFAKNLSIFQKNTSIFLQNTSQYFCRTPLSIFTEHLSIFLQNTSQYFDRTLLSIFADQLQYFCKTSRSIFTEHLSIFYRTLLSIFAEHFSVFSLITFQFFCKTPLNIFTWQLNIFIEHF